MPLSSSELAMPPWKIVNDPLILLLSSSLQPSEMLIVTNAYYALQIALQEGCLRKSCGLPGQSIRPLQINF